MMMKNWILLLALATVTTTGGSCEKSRDDEHTPAPGDTVAHRPIEAVLREHTDDLMGIDGVVSVGQALCGERPCIRVGVRAITDTLLAQIPDTLEGYPIDLHELGSVRPRRDL